MKIEHIETPRLYLRGFAPADASFAISIWNDPEMGEYLLDETMEAVSDEYFRQIQALGEDPECCYLIAEDKFTGERIGTCSFIPADGVYDIAYCVHKRFWRQGYATEMAGGMIGYARSRGAKKITAVISSENPGSNAIAQKFGFRIAETLIQKKRGGGREFVDYRYELDL
ncbi:MAG: GNAT family N-acetyltransferase [Oscillibacter sp.]|nr:GNAT family N-acetyltransferase [Oscillibacter sp.]